MICRGFSLEPTDKVHRLHRKPIKVRGLGTLPEEDRLGGGAASQMRLPLLGDDDILARRSVF
jgi:hypothetical protein